MELWAEVFLARYEGANELGDHIAKQVPLYLIAVFEYLHKAQLL